MVLVFKGDVVFQGFEHQDEKQSVASTHNAVSANVSYGRSFRSSFNERQHESENRGCCKKPPESKDRRIQLPGYGRDDREGTGDDERIEQHAQMGARIVIRFRKVGARRIFFSLVGHFRGCLATGQPRILPSANFRVYSENFSMINRVRSQGFPSPTVASSAMTTGRTSLTEDDKKTPSAVSSSRR